MIMLSCHFSFPSKCPPLRTSYLDQTLASISRIQALVPSFVSTYYYNLIGVLTLNSAVQQYILLAQKVPGVDREEKNGKQILTKN
jgi:hypothetical protein